MAFEFDHLFICTDVGANAADHLVSLGLREGSSSTHPGQGTANRRFFFHNAKLELLWVHSPEEAKSDLINPTHLWERWRDRQQGACPFGFCLRSTDASIAFSSWAYRPPYLPKTLSIAVGTNSFSLLTEPMLFQTPFGQRPDHFSAEKAQPINHPLGLREITRVEFVSPHTIPSPELQAVLDTRQLSLRTGVDYSVELGFDQETQGQKIDFRPDLPLVICY
ncbi:MAG: VOC family protein [Drouetiella hepatica Uher 2000/2452]|uniref:VOC family protein n=1 Tax=Drouetiella hepatica Uher 2000/2452 TaxID=904376 RepID=A0A951UPG3_9CYAN|nr:VOC family protein [Drouetiella hepatica Uher 2000/2452]